MANPITAGEAVVDFCLPGAEDGVYDSREARKSGLLLFAIYKAGCGTCQFTVPFLQRFHDAYSGPGLQVWGVSQEDRDGTLAFKERFGLRFPQLVDENLGVSAAYGLISVPGIYLVDAGAYVLRHAPAFVKAELNAMARLASERTGKPYAPVVRDEDDAPDHKPG